MKPGIWCLVLAFLLPVRVVAAEGEFLDRVWSGHPVGFALLTERGYQFVAYYDAERRITVAGRRLGDAKWTRVQPAGVPVGKRTSNVTGWDSHNTLRLALDRDGCLHLSGNMHANPLVYYRTRLPFDLKTLERLDRMTGERETRCTYPVFFKNAAGDLLFRYRDGGSGNGSDLYNIYDPGTRAWRRMIATPLLEGQGERNAYAIEPTLGPDGRFHLVWMWRETPDCATNHSLSYARSRDFVHWENSRGEPIALPIVLATGDIIDAARPGEGLINMTFNLGFDAQQRPVVVYHRYDANRKSQAYVARPNEGQRGWAVRPMSDWNFQWAFAGGGSIDGEVKLGPPRLEHDGSLVVDFSTKQAGAGRWRLRADTLERIEKLPATPSSLPASFRHAQSTVPGMEVQSVISRADGRRWGLRWETLGRNRDKPREIAPPPTELRLYELPDSEVPAATNVGS
ncbi:BNR repeat-containing protein [Horticoccus sp. 23ND18S-11]|uniref:BNR repeat-containing protein n=1 Tax=Horticoccus sp. 23ND18S-11 TaxID=3391832 RepID=UPI0039C9008A